MHQAKTMTNEVKSLVELCASSITNTIQTSKFASDLSEAKKKEKHPLPKLMGDLIGSLILLSAVCLKNTIEYGLYGKFASELSSAEREGNAINIDSEWISDPFHKLVECFVKLGTRYMKNTVKNRKIDLSAISLKDNAINLSRSSLKRKFEPLHQLPLTLLEEIMEFFIRSQKPIDAEILDHLVTPLRQRLSFSVYSDSYLRLFPKLGNLLKLDFENTAVGYDCLKSIGIYCSKLRSLNLKNCVNVKDTGIQCLCGGVDYPELGNGKAGLCRTLTELNIRSTSVTQQGIQMALKYLLVLKVIEHKNAFEVLVALAQSAVNSNFSGRSNNLLSLSILYTPWDLPHLNGNLQLAISMCHSINHVVIYTTMGLKDSDLICLMSIKTLRGLKIYSAPTYVPNEIEITFADGLLPLLKVIGKSLEILSFYCFDSIRISAIAEFCPNLTYLHINNATDLLTDEEHFFRMNKKLPIFHELTSLYCEYDIPSYILLILLSSPLLTYIGIFDCTTLTDEFLQKAALHHRFHKLEKLFLKGCNGVSKRGIDAFLVEINPLKKNCLEIC